MNAKQRRKLQRHQRCRCDRCGMKEKHWIETAPAKDINWFVKEAKGKGFYTCPDLYDKVTGRRKDQSDNPMALTETTAMTGLLMLFAKLPPTR